MLENYPRGILVHMCPSVVQPARSLHCTVEIHLRTTAPHKRLPARRAVCGSLLGSRCFAGDCPRLLRSARYASRDRVCWGMLGTACDCSNSCVPPSTKEQHKGRGGGLHFRTSPSWASSAAFVCSMWVYTRALLLVVTLQNLRGHNNGRGHGPISSRTKFCPPTSPKISISDSVLHAKDKTRRGVYMAASFLPSSMVSKLPMPCFVFFLYTLINLYAKYERMCVNAIVPVACFVRPSHLCRYVCVGVSRASYAWCTSRSMCR